MRRFFGQSLSNVCPDCAYVHSRAGTLPKRVHLDGLPIAFAAARDRETKQGKSRNIVCAYV